MAFSATLSLETLNDFLGPSAICIKPVEVAAPTEPSTQEKKGFAATEIQIDKSGAYFEQDDELTAPKKLAKAEITLNDCLACSGCITSAESVLVSMQSHEELYRVLEEQPTLTPVLSISPQSLASLAAAHDISPETCLKGLRQFFRQHLNFHSIFDTTFARSISLQETQQEWRERSSTSTSLPILASACPGWICYAEKTHAPFIPFISAVKSPQAIMGTLIKDWWRTNHLPQATAADVYHVTVMPCYDKKLEASRPDFTPDGVRETDCVLTTGEVLKMMQEKDLDLRKLAESYTHDARDSVFPELLAAPGSSSGSYLHQTISSLIASLPASSLPDLRLSTKSLRGDDYIDYTLTSPSGTLFKGATCYGFRNLSNLVRKLGREKNLVATKGAIQAKRLVSRKKKDENERGYDYIEVMACPSGCVNGGGQLPASSRVVLDEEGLPRVDENLSGKDWVALVEERYWAIGQEENRRKGDEVHQSLLPYLSSSSSTSKSEELIARIRKDMADRTEWCRTQYRAVESEEMNGLAVKW